MVASYAIAVIALLVIILMALVRAFKGPKVYDRVLAVNMVGTKIVLLIAVYGFLTDRPEFLDLSIFYALINFIGVIAVLKFVERIERHADAGER